uniref:Uncharacterized protein n=1 Tax=Rhizophora mucronata TaxID=61149 RepID=A0A2P2IGZ3_RHIMU
MTYPVFTIQCHWHLSLHIHFFPLKGLHVHEAPILWSLRKD